MGGTQGLGNMFNFGEMFPMTEGVGEMPRATVMREKMGKMLKVADAASDLQKAQSVFNNAMSEHMGKAVERTIEHLATLAEKGEPITSVRDLMRTWFGIADKTLNEAFMSEEFLAKQADMTKALLKFKVTRRDALELIYDSMELPTRSSIDEAYRDIHALKERYDSSVKRSPTPPKRQRHEADVRPEPPRLRRQRLKHPNDGTSSRLHSNGGSRRQRL